MPTTTRTTPRPNSSNCFENYLDRSVSNAQAHQGPSPRRVVFAPEGPSGNLATSLFEHGRIKTTEPKARALRPYAEKLITHAKKGTLHNRREVLKKIRDKDVVHALFAEIGPFFADRNGGYTRIIKVEARKGDNAPMAVIELVREKTVTSEADRARRVKASKKAAPPAAKAAPEEAKVEQPEELEAEEAKAEAVEAEPEAEEAPADEPDEATED